MVCTWILGAGLISIQGCRSHDVAMLDAIEKQEIGNVKRLLEGGARAEIVPLGENSFPIEAAAKGGNPEIVQMLLAAGASPDSARGPETPLWWAMLRGHEEVAVLLVDAQARFDGPVNQGMMPFYFAVMHDYSELVAKMVAHSADVYAFGPLGSPLHEAADNGNLGLAKLLVLNGANVNRINDLGETPIFQAAAQGHFELLEWLVQTGADINAADKLGSTVLHQLASGTDSLTIQKICLLKPNPNIQNLVGETPLHCAAARGNESIARALIYECHADLNFRDHHDLSPAGLAYREGQTEMVEFLTSRGGRLR